MTYQPREGTMDKQALADEAALFAESLEQDIELMATMTANLISHVNRYALFAGPGMLRDSLRADEKFLSKLERTFQKRDIS